MDWESLYNNLQVRDFIYFISSADIQDMLFPVKVIFIAFAIFFLTAIIYFMMNSSYLKYQLLEDVTEFFSWQAYGLKEVSKRWNKIKSKIKEDSEASYKLAIIEADEFLTDVLEDRGYSGKSFEEAVEKIDKETFLNIGQLKEIHQVRNSIVYNPDYKLDINQAKKILATYEQAINNIWVS
ncbi:MAG: hypothetical protein HYT36_00920 [Candidatus Staskawiczbacteria bacterium]|nr:hypothetical protein [Candidatus Staskawiczbacteria bacterium]